MTVRDLIYELSQQPLGAEVVKSWGGQARGRACGVYLSRKNQVVIHHSDPIMEAGDRPPDAPTPDDKIIWTPNSTDKR